jgi:hypothetical protein
MNPFLSLRNYEEFVYTLKQRFPLVQGSTLTVVPRGKRMAIVQGEIAFAHGYRITLKERLSFDEGPVVNTQWHSVKAFLKKSQFYKTNDFNHLRF